MRNKPVIAVGLVAGISAAVAGIGILTGPEMQGLNQPEPPPHPQTLLDIVPEGEGVYYNLATDTALITKCKKPDPSEVTCGLRVVSNYAQLDYRQTFGLKVNADGTLQVSSNYQGQRPWSDDAYDAYKSAKKSGKQIEWNSTSPFAQSSPLPQNGIRQINLIDKYAVEAVSIVPISEKFGIKIGAEFNAGAKSVQSYAVPMVSFGNDAYSIESQKASRAFDVTTLDQRFYESLGKKARSTGPVFENLSQP